MSKISDIFKTWKNKDPNWKYRNDKFTIGWNLYSNNPDETWGENVRKFHRVHFTWKYKILVPLIKIGKLFFKKAQVNKEDIADEPYNKNFFIMDKSFDEAIDDWIKYYRLQGLKATPKQIKRMYGGSTQLLRDIYGGGKTFCFYDSAYREFLNMFLFRITINMNKAYEKTNPPLHILYTSKSMNDVKYKTIWKAAQEMDLYNFMISKKIVITNPPEGLAEEVNEIIKKYKNEAKQNTANSNQEVPGNK